MAETRFEISNEILTAFPDIGVCVLRTVISDQNALVGAEERAAEELSAVRAVLDKIEPISSMPQIVRWREAYRELGVKPSKYLSSIEALLRRVKKNEIAITGIPAVDLYNTISITEYCPLGAYDLSKLSDEMLCLRLARPDEDRFQPIGGDSNSFPLNPKLAVYAQGRNILCWGFNSRDSITSAVDKTSTNIVFFGEGTSKEAMSSTITAMQKLSRIIQECGGQVNDIVKFDSANRFGYF